MSGRSWLKTCRFIALCLTFAAAPAAAQRAPAACTNGGRDDFSAAQLDRARWSTVIRENSTLRIADGNLVIPTTNTDIAFTAGHPAYTADATPNIVLQALPQGPFVATTKVSLTARVRYQQAGLVLYGDDDNYAKLVFFASEDDAAGRKVGLFVEKAGQLEQIVGEPLGATFPDAVWVRLTSDGEKLSAAYSADGTTFTDVPGTAAGVAFSSAAMTPKLGLLALASGLASAPAIDAKFDSFEVCPGKPAK